MARGPTIGVLSPYVGGSYYGEILAGIASATSAAGGRVVAVQTLAAGSFHAETDGTPCLQQPVAWDHVAGFVVVAGAVDADYLDALRAAGKPVVLVSNEPPRFPCPLVLPDNGGIRTAVAHLIEHGHRRIAFAGALSVFDIRERYDGYVETMRDHGIEPDPLLLFDTGNNHEVGGDDAARNMVAAGLPSTAVVAATDLNAIGVMRTLRAAGYDLPQDQAVVGFDDIDAARHHIPSLSSVRQPKANLGKTAVELLLRLHHGEQVAPGRHYVPAPFITRESCGCSDAVSPRIAEDPAAAVPGGAALPSPGSLPSARNRLTTRLESLLLTGVPRAEEATAFAAGVDAIVRLVEAAVLARPTPVVAHLRHELHGLYHLIEQPEQLAPVTQAVRTFGGEVAAAGGDDAATDRIDDLVHELTLALSQEQVRAQFGDTTYFQAMLSTQYEMSMGLLHSHEEDPRRLGWLIRTSARGGCLGLWTELVAPDGLGDGQPACVDRELAIAGVFVRDRVQPVLCAPPQSASAFPPVEMLALAAETPGDVVFVVPVRIDSGDWGWLTVVGPVEDRAPAGREIVNQSAALLAVALDHEAVLVSLREQEDQLRRSALYDGLTGLPNRTLFLDRLSLAIARARRGDDCTFAVLFFDIDDFKVVNDSLGHAAGDRLLVKVAARLVEDLREVDTAARFGGDEFLVLLEGTRDLASATSIAGRLQSALARPFDLSGDEVVVTASVGIALSASRYDSAEDVLRDADIAMYSAKSHEKGTQAVFDVAMHTKAVTRLQTEADLRRALERGEFELHYQPIVNLGTHALSAFEALIRWRHPTRGLMAPDLFLSVAEECGLMVPIGRWVLTEACRQLAAWQAAGVVSGEVAMSVNVSNRQFWHDDLLEVTKGCLRDTGLAPRCLALEITESVIMSNVDEARTMLGGLHLLGVAVHIDDFGTGYSSLEALHNLPLDALKIDRSFVARLDNDPRSAELVRTIVLMGANLGLDLIAEGVETSAQRDHLHRLGCTFGQGYLFSRPVPGALAEQIAADLRDHLVAPTS